jgi:hypothetical protein
MHMGGEGHQFHAMDFLFYAYLQSGRDADAKVLFDEVKAMPDEHHDMYGMGFDPRVATLVQFTALYPLERHHWADAAAIVMVPGASNGEPSVLYWARAIGAAHLCKANDVGKDAAAIDALHKKLLEEKKTDFAEAVDHDHTQGDGLAPGRRG